MLTFIRRLGRSSRRRLSPAALSLTLFLLTAALACGPAATTNPEPAASSDVAPAADQSPVTKKAVVESLTAQVILPRYQAAAAAMQELDAAAQTLCAAPDTAALTAARQAWRAARAAWQQTAPIRFGPVMTRKSLGLVDWPAAPAAELDAMLSRRQSLTPNDVLEFLPSDRRGLGAMEHLLFGADAATLAALADPATLRCAYLTALTQTAAAEVAAVRDEWVSGSPDSGPYQAVFDGTAASSLHESAALADFVGSIVFLTQRLARMQLAPALGMDGVTPDPAALAAGPAANAVAELTIQVQAIQAVYSGDGQLGLTHLVRQLSPEVDQQTIAALAAALDAIDNLEEPLPETILSNPAPSQTAFDRLIDIQRLFNADIASLLNVSIGFSDQDGDS